ncbi:MAG: ATP-binding cassette domain-containing protein [Fibromonadales bacterium]|nr:ATP-binding cassette domain-containing protein [Fibromonadales bacterium]
MVMHKESWAIIGYTEPQKADIVKALGKKLVNVSEIIEKDKADDAWLDEENLLNPGQKASDLLPENCERYLKKFNLLHTVNTSIRYLSTGEIAKILLVAEISKNPDMLVLDKPFDGLDVKSREELSQLIPELMKDGVCVVMFMNNDSIQAQSEVVQLPPKIGENAAGFLPEDLVILRNVKVKYGERLVLDNLNFTVNKGEHWKITGPNGCGKSTLLSLISGDNPQSFVNDITLFGIKRGSGETIWDIKKNIGIVSTLFHRNYTVAATALEVVISGFHDTIGVYRTPTRLEKETALLWLKLAGIKGHANEPFQKLPYGEQRLILILRAMVKHPPVLILDEPCFGLEPQSRKLVLDFVEILAQSKSTTILFVSHREDDFVKSIKNHLKLSLNKNHHCHRYQS